MKKAGWKIVNFLRRPLPYFIWLEGVPRTRFVIRFACIKFIHMLTETFRVNLYQHERANVAIELMYNAATIPVTTTLR